MDVKKIKESLGRSKATFLKGETLRSLGFAVTALKDIVKSNAPLPMELRGLIREVSQFLQRDEEIKKRLKAPIVYQPGQEKQLLIILADIYKDLLAKEGFEDRKTALNRKQMLDKALVLGQKLLAQGKVSEADAAFQEAISHYKDEHRVFQLIAKNLLEAKQPVRAMGYIKRGMEIEPTNTNLADYLVAARKMRESGGSAEEEE